MDTATATGPQQQLETLYEQRRALNNQITQLLHETGVMDSVQDYELQDADGNPVRLSEAFGDRDQLILVHNMGFKCSYCTMWADGLNALYPYIAKRAAFVLVSNDEPARQKQGAAQRGWTFPMLSARGTTLFTDLGFGTAEDGWWPGVSVLVKNPDGSLRRHSRDFFGPGDVYNGAWHLFDLLERNDEDIEPTEGLGQTPTE